MSSRRPVQLYNSSPETVHWVATLLDDAVGSENLTDLKPENLVQISPSSGTLKPYSAQKVEISILVDKNLPISSQLIIYSQFSLISRYTFLKRVLLSSTQTRSVQHIGSTQGPHLLSTQNPSVQHKNPSVPHQKPLSTTPKTPQFNEGTVTRTGLKNTHLAPRSNSHP